MAQLAHNVRTNAYLTLSASEESTPISQSLSHAPAKPKTAADKLWASYWADRSAENRNALIVNYLPVVRFAAIKLAAKRRYQTDVDELIQYGTFGLKDAINGYDPSRKIKFETYCSMRVRGAMLDGLKAMQWAPREVRQTLTRFLEEKNNMEAEFGEAPDAERIAVRLGVNVDAVNRMDRDSASLNMVSLTGSSSMDVDGPTAADLAVDYREEGADDMLQREDVRDLFLRECTRNERLVMTMYYYENMTMREIGDVLGISGTRVSQMHSEVLVRLRERLTARVSDENGSIQDPLDI